MKLPEKHISQSGNKIQFLAIVILVVLPFFVIISLVKRELDRSIWDAKSRLNIVFAADSIFLASFNPYDNSVAVVMLPDGLYDKVSGSYGNYPLSGVWKLSAQEEKKGLLFAKTVQSITGLPVDGWVGGQKGGRLKLGWEINRESLAKIQNEIKNTPTLNFLKNVFWDNRAYDTNLSLYDIFRIFNKLKNVRADKFTILNLNKLSVLSNDRLPDGTPVQILDKNKFDNSLGDIFADSNIQREGLSIMIKNAGGQNGLGGKFSRLIINSGGHVIGIDNASPLEDSVCEIAPDKKNYFTVRKIISLTSCRVEYKNPAVADFIISLGKNINRDF